MQAPVSPFERYMSERILSFADLKRPSISGPKALKNVSTIRHIRFQWKVTEHFLNRIKKIWSVRTKIALTERKNSQTRFCCLCVNLPSVKIWGQSDKFPKSFSFLQCPFQVEKLIRENSTKYVNQTGNFHFQAKLKTAISRPVFNLFQWYLFDIRDIFLWIITLTEKSKFEQNCRSEGIL